MKQSTQRRWDSQILEQRRRQAAKLFDDGQTRADVARALRVSRVSVTRWWRRWRRGGEKALCSDCDLGRRPRLTERQLLLVDRALREGPLAHGFSTDLWTLPRVADVIHSATGVRYHPGHVWKILRSLGWSLQRPARRARERDEQKVLQWISKRWPELKKTAKGGEDGFSSSMKPVSAKSHRSGARGHPEEKRRS